MSIDQITTFFFLILKSPSWYKASLVVTIIFLFITISYGIRMYQESQKHHDFFLSDVRIFLEKEFNELKLTFNAESLQSAPVYINQVQVAIYDTMKPENKLYQATTGGKVNPLKKGDKFSSDHVLDGPFELGFNLSKVIREHEFEWQAYKVIIVVHYNHNSLSKLKNQRFEYLYNVVRSGKEIKGVLREQFNKMNDSKLIHKDIPYEI